MAAAIYDSDEECLDVMDFRFSSLDIAADVTITSSEQQDDSNAVNVQYLYAEFDKVLQFMSSTPRFSSSISNKSIPVTIANPFLDEYGKVVWKFYHESKRYKSEDKKVVAVENSLSSLLVGECIHSENLNELWQPIVNFLELPLVDGNVFMKIILQHLWTNADPKLVFSKVNNSPDTDDFNMYNFSTEENEHILYHAGWCFKRSREVILAHIGDFEVFRNPADKNHIVVKKGELLNYISFCGHDSKTNEHRHIFIVKKAMLPVFQYMHFESQIILKDLLLKQCYDAPVECIKVLSTDGSLRGMWYAALATSGLKTVNKPTATVMLNYLVPFFIKSKQKEVRVKTDVQPNKKSGALRSVLKEKVLLKHSSTSVTADIPCSSKENIHPLILNVRSVIENKDALLPVLKEICSGGNNPNLILNQLNGKELTKLLRTLKKPSLSGKAKTRQISVLLSAVSELSD